MFEDAKRFVTRKIKKIEFLNTHFPQDYEAVNSEYKRLRDELSNFANTLEKLSNYEFGGSMMKNVSKISKTISSNTKLNLMNPADIYSEAASIGEELANTTHSNTLKGVGTKFSQAYQKVAAAKKQMNAGLKEVIGSIRVLKEDSKSIDAVRRSAEDLRYDLEEKIQENTEPKSVIEGLSTAFNSKALEALRGMKTFMGEAGISGLLKKAAVIHKEFNEQSAKAFASIE